MYLQLVYNNEQNYVFVYSKSGVHTIYVYFIKKYANTYNTRNGIANDLINLISVLIKLIILEI